MRQFEPIDEIERLIRRDPARRGLIATEESRGPLCPGHLARAAADLATHGKRVLIVTGFFIPGATPPSAETDGPPGAAILGAALASVGMSVQFATDERCLHAVQVAVDEMEMSPSLVTTPGRTPMEIERWFENTIVDATQPPLTHLVAIERVGPSHSRNSMQNQFDARLDVAEDPASPLVGTQSPQSKGTSLSQDEAMEIAEFEELVPESDWNKCYNMRGVCLEEHTAPLHRLFELAMDHQQIKSIGIGDGGNEIGMGNIRWQELRSRLSSPAAARIPCRIRTNWTIIAGVSNWGGMALAAATLLLRNMQSNMQPWTASQQQHLLERLVTEGPAVDGITQLPEPTVDGLPFRTYIQPWEGIRRVAGRADA